MATFNSRLINKQNATSRVATMWKSTEGKHGKTYLNRIIFCQKKARINKDNIYYYSFFKLSCDFKLLLDCQKLQYPNTLLLIKKKVISRIFLR